MNYEKLLRAGREMTAVQVNGTIAELAKDPRFAAVVVWLERNKESFRNASESQGLAAHHGSLAHACGSGYGVKVLEGQLRNLIDPPAAQARQRQEEETG